MYSNLSLYYLNQLGIRPWVKRVNAEKTQSAKQKSLKLLVLVSSNLSNKGKSLLTQMLAYLGLAEQDLNIIAIHEQDSFGHDNAQIKQYDPLVTLILGLNTHQLAQEDSLEASVVHSIDPDYLIMNPVEKGKIFKTLHYIKQIIS